MSVYPALRHRPPGAGTLAVRVLGAVACGLGGWVVAGISQGMLVPVTAVFALAAALALTVFGARTRALVSPSVLLGVPLLLSLAAAMVPVTRIFGDWSLRTLVGAILIVVVPLIGVAAAAILLPGRARLGPGTPARPYPGRLVAVCLLMCVAGTVQYLSEWAGVGGPPLLSGSIDKTRFAFTSYGLLHVATEGLPLALLIATWARVGRGTCFSGAQRRTLEAIICFVPLVLALGGARTLVLVPAITAFVVSARYLSRRAVRRLVVVIPVGVLAFSAAVFLARIGQEQQTVVAGSVLYDASGAKSSPIVSTFRTLSINLGEQLRVVAELRDANVHTPPLTTSIWFLHNILPRAENPSPITAANAGGWLASTYAGALVLDFGLGPALIFGFALGAAAHALYRRFARGATVLDIWVYAYLAAPIALAFYINFFLYFIYPIIDLIALFALSRLLIEPAQNLRPPAVLARGAP